MRVKKLSANRRSKGHSDDPRSPSQSPVHECTSSSEWSSGSASPVRTNKAMSQSDASMDGNDSNDDMSDNWREHVEREVRTDVHGKIVAYLTALKPHAPTKVLEKLPGLADRMEQSLWTMATSAREYADEATLAQRLTMMQQLNAKRVLEQVAPTTQEARLPVGQGIQNRTPLSEDQARVVFSCLQSWRQRMVNLFGATPSEIAPNATLAKLSLFVPSTQQDLLSCGVTIEQAERFGPSLLQEMQKIGAALTSGNGRSLSPLGFKRGSPTRAGSKRDTQKKRKTSPETSPMAAAAPTLPAGLMNAAIRLNQNNFLSQSSIMSSVALLARASEATLPSSGLPVLLPSATLGRNAFGLPSAPGSSSSSTSSSSSRVSPNGQPTSLFPRFPITSTDAADAQNRMQMLAHEAGKQEQEHAEAKLRDMFEQEIYALRRRLEESEGKRAALEAEVQELRQQHQVPTTQ